jgi:hypothetical protein
MNEVTISHQPTYLKTTKLLSTYLELDNNWLCEVKYLSSLKYIHTRTYHSGLIVVVAEAYQIFLRDAHVYQNDLAMRNTADVTGKPIAI